MQAAVGEGVLSTATAGVAPAARLPAVAVAACEAPPDLIDLLVAAAQILAAAAAAVGIPRATAVRGSLSCAIAERQRRLAGRSPRSVATRSTPSRRRTPFRCRRPIGPRA